MSAILIKIGNNYNSAMHHEYQLLKESDLSDLPGMDVCAIGSYAYMVADENVIHMWILCEDNTWRQAK